MKKRNVEAVEEKPKKTVVKLRYFIFNMSEEGHLTAPKYNDYGSIGNCFDSYGGYGSIEEASLAIVKFHEKDEYSCGHKYVILPIATVEQEDAQ